jgi:LmbE family N-acetylglucosaminyl deacetylase
VTAAEALRAAERLPLRTLSQVLEGRPFVVIAPHPDDESLACGGLLALASREGIRAAIVIVSDGAGSHPGSRAWPPARLAALREREGRRAAEALGMRSSDVIFLRLPDRYVPSEGAEAEAAVAKIARCIEPLRAGSAFVTWRHDPHCDHQACYTLARAVQRRSPGLKLYEYTVWGGQLPAKSQVDPVRGGFRLAIEDVLEAKRRAIAEHRSQTTGLIDDDPAGFRLGADHLARFDLPYEAFFASDP